MKKFLEKYTDELLLNSGQYALFYILMNFSLDGIYYFSNLGHSLLIVFLIIQTYILAKFGHLVKVRFWGSMVVPLCYSIVESLEGIQFVLNTGHFFFWIFSILTALLQSLLMMTKNKRQKIVYEYLLTFTNIIIFLFIYFYFDIKLGFLKLLKTGAISDQDLRESLEFYNLLKEIPHFFADPAHIYIALGGLILSFSLAKGRSKISELKEKINELFGKYVDKKIRDKLIIEGDNRKSESREICILFSDIRNFTKITESWPPEKVVKSLNYYFSEWDKIITTNHGIIDKFDGDAIMVLFGVHNENTACDNSVKCALEMIKILPKLNQFLKENNLPEINEIGVGINFGAAIVGDIGSSERLNFTAIGDSVNVASRIESLCKEHNINIIISQSVFDQIENQEKSKFSPLGVVPIRGKQNSVTLWGFNNYL